jgi:hypothetical protein
MNKLTFKKILKKRNIIKNIKKQKRRNILLKKLSRHPKENLTNQH